MERIYQGLRGPVDLRVLPLAEGRVRVRLQLVHEDLKAELQPPRCRIPAPMRSPPLTSPRR